VRNVGHLVTATGPSLPGLLGGTPGNALGRQSVYFSGAGWMPELLASVTLGVLRGTLTTEARSSCTNKQNQQGSGGGGRRRTF